ncbi:hypothetical protein [Herbidospora sp. RD11066]
MKLVTWVRMLAAVVLVALMEAPALAEQGIRIANHCEPPLD